MTEKQLIVASGIVYKDDKILIAKRPTGNKFEGGKWEFSGGKVEMCEDPSICLARELKEELGIDVLVKDIYAITSVILENSEEKRHVILLTYKCNWQSGEVENIESEDSKWVTMDELKDYIYTVGTDPVVKKLLKEFN